MWANLGLQLSGIILIAWAAIASAESKSMANSLVVVYALIICGMVVLLLQLVPLPPDLWTELPGRTQLARGFAMLGYPLPNMPVSFSPYLSVRTIFATIPALAVFTASVKLEPSPRIIASVIVSGMALGILLGAVQVAGGPNSWAYLYQYTNTGAVGFFANQNHMATLLLVGIPMATVLFASAKPNRRSAAGHIWIAAALLFLVLVGIVLNGSLAAFLLVVPVVLASASLLPSKLGWRRLVLPTSVVALMVAFGVVATYQLPGRTSVATASNAVALRSSIWSTTSEAIADTFPVGTGLGSFPQVYRQYENPSSVTTDYVNHAHNDYLELVLELGAPGAILLAVFILWWCLSTIRIWSSRLSTPFARAATISTATILAHSLVDFPLRTAAISAIFAASIALMAQPLRRRASQGELRPARHVELG